MHFHVWQMPGAEPDVVGDEDIALVQRFRRPLLPQQFERYSVEHVSSERPIGQRTDHA